MKLPTFCSHKQLYNPEVICDHFERPQRVLCVLCAHYQVCSVLQLRMKFRSTYKASCDDREFIHLIIVNLADEWWHSALANLFHWIQ